MILTINSVFSPKEKCMAVFVVEKECVYFEVRISFLNKVYNTLFLQMVKAVHMNSPSE
jgi:predicted alternative tryptophan synthase beta-subunit